MVNTQWNIQMLYHRIVPSKPFIKCHPNTFNGHNKVLQPRMLTKMCHNQNSQRMLKEDNMGQLLWWGWGGEGCNISFETQNSSNVSTALGFFKKDLLAVAIGGRWR